MDKLESIYIKASAEWKKLSIPGVYLQTLKTFEEGGSTVLIKMEAGSSFPLHDHLAGEETYILEGEIKIGKYKLKAGDYLYTPPGSLHASHTKAGCTLLATTHKPLKFIKKNK